MHPYAEIPRRCQGPMNRKHNMTTAAVQNNLCIISLLFRTLLPFSTATKEHCGRSYFVFCTFSQHYLFSSPPSSFSLSFSHPNLPNSGGVAPSQSPHSTTLPGTHTPHSRHHPKVPKSRQRVAIFSPFLPPPPPPPFPDTKKSARGRE